jgi:TldD protein
LLPAVGSALIHPVIPELTLRQVLAEALSSGGDFAEVYAQDRSVFSLALEDGRIERVRSGRDRGVGVRVVAGEVTGYASTEDLAPASLLEAARVAAAITRRGACSLAAPLRRRRPPTVAREAVRPESMPERQRADLLRRADQAARAVHPAVSQVTIQLRHSRLRVRIANSEGLLVSDERPFLQFTVAVTAQRGTLRQVGRRTRGGQVGLELLNGDLPEQLAGEAAGVAVRLLDARPAPAGRLPVVIRSGWGGVLFHEAVGHGLEADYILTGSSAYAGKLGSRVADRAVTLIDNATVPGHRGSYRVDDEGYPARQTVLIESGVLRAYLTDRRTAAHLRLPRSGNGRRQSFSHLPLPRMSNLYIAPGTVEPETLIADTPRGLYVVSLGGGMVEPASGQFVFSVTEGYLIDRGRLAAPVRGATLAGEAFTVLQDVDAIGSDFSLDPGVGTCGKQGQSVAVGVGQPTIRVRELLVGGTA